MPDNKFTYYVCDLISGAIIEEIEFATFEWSRAKNAPGGWSGTISHRHKKNTAGLLEPWRRSVFVGRDQVIFGGGMLTQRTSNTDTGMTVGGQGHLAYYRNKRRKIRSRQGMTFATGANSLEVTFTAIDQLNIAKDLILHAAAFGGGANIGYDTVNLLGPGAAGISGVNRTRTYWTYENKSIGDAIDDLAKLYAGFEYAESYAWGSQRIGRQLDFFYPSKGLTAGLEFEAGRNVILLNRTEDGEELTTRATATGAGQDDAQLFSEAINSSLESPAGVYPLLENLDSFPDLATQALLDSQSLRMLNERKQPFQTLEMQVKEDADIHVGSFDWGDNIRCVVDDYAIQVNGLYRVEQFTCSIDENGKIDIKPTLTSYEPSIGI